MTSVAAASLTALTGMDPAAPAAPITGSGFAQALQGSLQAAPQAAAPLPGGVQMTGTAPLLDFAALSLSTAGQIPTDGAAATAGEPSLVAPLVTTAITAVPVPATAGEAPEVAASVSALPFVAATPDVGQADSSSPPPEAAMADAPKPPARAAHASAGPAIKGGKPGSPAATASPPIPKMISTAAPDALASVGGAQEPVSTATESQAASPGSDDAVDPATERPPVFATAATATADMLPGQVPPAPSLVSDQAVANARKDAEASATFQAAASGVANGASPVSVVTADTRTSGARASDDPPPLRRAATAGDQGFAAQVQSAADGHAAESASSGPVPVHAAFARASALAAPVPNPTASALEQPTISARAGQIGNEMGVEIARKVSVGGTDLVVRLDPVEFGRIEVRMSFDERGSLRAVVSAESTAALDLLRRDAADLGRALNDAGVRSDAQSFRFDSRGGGTSGGGDGNQFWRQQQASRQSSQSGRPNAAAPTEELAYRALPISGRVDLMA